MGLYACYGLAWLLIAAFLLYAPLRPRQRGLLLLGLVVLPGLVTLITLDGTRVFVDSAWPAFALFVRGVVQRDAEGAAAVPMRTLACLALLMALIAPSYVSGGGNVSRPRFGSALKALAHQVHEP